MRTGTPFQFLVTDMTRAGARGDGLGRVKSGQVATFYITAPAAQLKDICVNISGMSTLSVERAALLDDRSLASSSIYRATIDRRRSFTNT